MDVAVEQLQAFTASRQHEVVRHALVVVEKVALDHVRSMSEAQDEVLVPEMSVVLHDVPQDGAIPNLHHRLGDVLGIADPQAQSAAEQNDLHAYMPPPVAWPSLSRSRFALIALTS